MVGFPILQGGFVSPMRAALYARVSTHDQQTLAMQKDACHLQKLGSPVPPYFQPIEVFFW